MVAKIDLPGDLLSAQRMLALVGAGAYRGSIAKDASAACRAVEAAFPIAEPKRQLGRLEGVHMMLRALSFGGTITRAECQNAVYTLHQFLSDRFPAARMDPEELMAARSAAVPSC